jgi:hypothetical protein
MEALRRRTVAPGRYAPAEPCRTPMGSLQTPPTPSQYYRFLRLFFTAKPKDSTQPVLDIRDCPLDSTWIYSVGYEVIGKDAQKQFIRPFFDLRKAILTANIQQRRKTGERKILQAEAEVAVSRLLHHFFRQYAPDLSSSRGMSVFFQRMLDVKLPEGNYAYPWNANGGIYQCFPQFPVRFGNDIVMKSDVLEVPGAEYYPQSRSDRQSVRWERYAMNVGGVLVRDVLAALAAPNTIWECLKNEFKCQPPTWTELKAQGFNKPKNAVGDRPMWEKRQIELSQLQELTDLRKQLGQTEPETIENAAGT